jgi:hypothetical protein
MYMALPMKQNNIVPNQ